MFCQKEGINPDNRENFHTIDPWVTNVGDRKLRLVEPCSNQTQLDFIKTVINPYKTSITA